MKTDFKILYFFVLALLGGCDSFKPLSINIIAPSKGSEVVSVKGYGKVFNKKLLYLTFEVENDSGEILKLDVNETYLSKPGGDILRMSDVDIEGVNLSLEKGRGLIELVLAEHEYRDFFSYSDIPTLEGVLALRNGSEEMRFHFKAD